MAEKTMNALYLVRENAADPAKLTYSPVRQPSLMPDHVLVRVHASAIHPSDVGNAMGQFPYTQYPRIVGRDYAGVVEDGPRDLLGLEVYGTSGYSYAFTKDGFQAEYSLIHRDEIAVKPKNLSFAQAATIGVPFTTAAQMVERAAVKQSDTVLVIGANGAVGSSIVQLVKIIGARVLKASRQDTDDVNTVKDPELKALDTLTGGKGIDVVLDTVGSPALMANSLKKLAKNGRLAFIAAPKTGGRDFTFDMRDFYRADLSILGCNSLNPSAREMAERLTRIRESFESGELVPEGRWTQVPLEQALGAYEKVISRATTEKFVVVMK